MKALGQVTAYELLYLKEKTPLLPTKKVIVCVHGNQDLEYAAKKMNIQIIFATYRDEAKMMQEIWEEAKKDSFHG